MTDESRPLIRFAVEQDQQDIIRLAAASQRQSMAEFARTVVLREAERVSAAIVLPKSKETPGRKSRQKT